MNAPVTLHRPLRPGDSALAARLRREIEGEVLFDAASRGRYSTDASIYQIEPVGVVVPRTQQDVAAALGIAREQGVPILPRGAGTSQCGQTVGAALVIDTSKHLDRVLEVDANARTAWVEPGLVLDRLNARLKADGLWFPVDVSTAAQATLGGMAGNNSCGPRSIRYGNMVHNVLAIDALLADGSECVFGPADEVDGGPAHYRDLVERIHAIARREAAEIEARWPKVLRRVQGYNLDMVQPHVPHNLAHLLVGSEGTLAWSRRLELKLAPLPAHKVLGVAHFPTFHRAMELTQEIVKLDPDAVELVDRTMIGLARDQAAFRPVVERYFLGAPDAILLVEFAGEDRAAQLAKLRRLVALLADLGLPGSVVEVTDASAQRDIWEVRKAGLNIMMSMKGDGKPVSFIEDCAVPLEHLAEYTQRLDEVFARHGTRGTWYAHASVGTLHVRPVLDMRRDGAEKMRAMAEEACALVRQFKGAFSGEHGDGLVRSEWIEPILGERLTLALGEIKDLLDPHNLFNPGKIVRATRMDDRTLFRFKPGVRNREDRHGVGLVGLGRARLGGRDVQQQRALSQVRRRHHVPVVPRHPRRDPFDARPCQYAAPRVVGPARRYCRCCRRGRSDGPLRRLQGLQARMSHRRGHGAPQDRDAASTAPYPAAIVARQARCVSAALRTLGGEGRTARQPWQRCPGGGAPHGEMARLVGAPLAAALVP